MLCFGRDSRTPVPPAGHHWKEVRHDNTVTWLASWTENIQGSIKYIMLNANSKLKVVIQLEMICLMILDVWQQVNFFIGCQGGLFSYSWSLFMNSLVDFNTPGSISLSILLSTASTLPCICFSVFISQIHQIILEFFL